MSDGHDIRLCRTFLECHFTRKAKSKAQVQADIAQRRRAEALVKTAYRVELSINQMTPIGALAKCIVVKQEDVEETVRVPDPNGLHPDRTREITRKQTVERRMELSKHHRN